MKYTILEQDIDVSICIHGNNSEITNLQNNWKTSLLLVDFGIDPSGDNDWKFLLYETAESGNGCQGIDQLGIIISEIDSIYNQKIEGDSFVYDLNIVLSSTSGCSIDHRALNVITSRKINLVITGASDLSDGDESSFAGRLSP